MKTRPATRPCAEFPCDNPLLYSEDGPNATPNGGLVQATGDEPHGCSDATSVFDWAATEYWVEELKRRWSVAKADAPEPCFAVLDATALELIEGNQPPTAPEVSLEDAEALELEEPALLTESGVVLGELLVMPSETLFDADEGVFGDDALALEVSDALPAGTPRVARTVLSGEADAALLESADDPFIRELLTLIPRRGSESDHCSDELGDVAPREHASDSEPLGASAEELRPAREVPGVVLAATEVAPESAPRPSAPEPSPPFEELASEAQLLVPLQLELTPTPARLSPWSEFTCALSRHLMNGGHTRAAALIGPLLCGELVDFSRLDAPVLERLLADGVAEQRGGRLVTTDTFRHAAKAFREEFVAGGLDVGEALFWLSQVLAALGGGARDEATLEAELRALGIAKLLERAA